VVVIEGELLLALAGSSAISDRRAREPRPMPAPWRRARRVSDKCGVGSAEFGVENIARGNYEQKGAKEAKNFKSKSSSFATFAFFCSICCSDWQKTLNL
jgi:hypothetical protein